MSAKLLLPLVLGLLALNGAAFATPAQTSFDNCIGPLPDSSATRSMALPPADLSGGSSDAIPVLSLDLNRPRLIMDVSFLAQETLVGPSSDFGAGVMLTFKTGAP